MGSIAWMDKAIEAAVRCLGWEQRNGETEAMTFALRNRH
jgi:hypothetical protein